MYGVIYKITNTKNGMIYIGQTTRSVKERFGEHMKSDYLIGRAIRKYGVENFTVEVIEECATPEQLNEREIFWIAKLNTKHPHGYNMTDGGEGATGLTEESLAKLRRKRTLETLKLMSVASKKRSDTPEGKATLDKARKSRWDKERARPPEERGWIRRTRKFVYPLLEAELVSRKLKYATVGAVLNMTGATFARKMNGTVGFTIEEATAVKNFLGVDIPLEKLFSRNDGFDATKTFSTRKADWSTYPVLKAVLEQKRISATEIARHLGLSHVTVSKKLRGKVGITPEQQAAIKKFLGVDMSVEELFRRQ